MLIIMNWDYYRYFIQIHRCGSLKLAGQKLGVNQTTVGRNLNALEAEVGTRLFERRSDGFVLTATGERILETIRQTEETILGVGRVLSGKDERPEGIVKIAAPNAFVDHWLIPKLAPFIKKHPRIELEFLTGAEVLNLARREADVAIRLVKPTQSGLMVRRVGALRLGIFGHPKLFEGKALPKKIEDILRLPFVGLYPDATSDAETALLQVMGRSVPNVVKSASWGSVHSAINAGLGIGILPTFMAQAPLVSILPEKMQSVPVWLVYHPDLRNAARVRAVIDFVLKQVL